MKILGIIAAIICRGWIDMKNKEIEELKAKAEGKAFNKPRKIEKVRDKVYERTRKSHKSK
jgi:hypothetical protein